MSTGRRNALRGPGEHANARLGKLYEYLRGLPSLDFSEKGRATICQRFAVTEAELNAAVQQAQPACARALSAEKGGVSRG